MGQRKIVVEEHKSWTCFSVTLLTKTDGNASTKASTCSCDYSDLFRNGLHVGCRFVTDKGGSQHCEEQEP